MLFRSGNNLRTWLVAAGLLSLVVQLHVAAAALLLPALVVLLLYGPRPRWRSTLVCTASFVFCYALLSPHALWLNLQAIVSLSDLPSTWTLQVLDSNNYIALALLVPVSIVLVRAGPRHKDRPQASRALLLFTGTGLIMMMGGAILMRRQLEPRYLAPLLPGMAMLAAGTTGRLIRLAYVMLPAPVHKALGGSAVHVSLLLALSLPAALAPGLRTPLHRNDPNIRNNLTFADVEAVANVLPDLGINTWPEALQYLRSPTAGDLLIGLSLHFPIPTSQLLIPNSQHPLPNSQFVLRLPPDSLTNIRADRVTVARKGGLGPLVLISVPDPFDWSRFAGAIPERHQPAPAPVPVHLALSPEASFGYPLLAGWSAPDRPVGWRLKVTAGPSDTDLVIVPLCPAYSHDCKASVTDEKTASGPEYLLKAGAVENLSFSWDFAFLAQHQAGLLPPILCFPSDEPGFREIIEALRPL